VNPNGDHVYPLLATSNTPPVGTGAVTYYHSAKTYEENMASLKRQVAPAKAAMFIGTSLGGFYASQLASSRIVPHSKALLINPAVYPEKTLIKWIGKNINFRTGEEYELTQEVVDSYKHRIALTREKSRGVPRIILLADHDEVLDHTETRKFWKGSGQILTISGGHRVEDYELVAKTAKELLDLPIV